MPETQKTPETTKAQKNQKNTTETSQKLTPIEQVEHLVKKLDAREFRVKNQALKDLGRIKHAKAREKLYEIASSPEVFSRLRVTAIDALGRGKKEKQFINLLNTILSNPEEDREIRRTAVTHLARLKDPKFIALFKEQLKDDYRFIRFWAVRALLKINTPKAHSALIQAIGDPDEEIRRDVLTHLEGIGASIVPNLINAFNSKDANKYLRYGVMGLMGRIEHPDTIPLMIKALKDGNERVVTIAIRGLGKKSDTKAISPLIEVAKENEAKRRLIQDSLYKIGQEQVKSVMKELLPLLVDKDEGLQKFAQDLAAKLSPESIFALEDFIHEKERDTEEKTRLKELIKELETA